MARKVSPAESIDNLVHFEARITGKDSKSTLSARVKTFLRRLSGPDVSPALVLNCRDSLGVGGHAQVVSGTLNSKKVAVKIMSAADPSAEREIRVATSLPPHPNVVTVGSVVASRSQRSLYLPMELCECDALTKFVERGHATPTDVIQVFRDAAAGLAHLHANGIYHLDVKPENILMSGGVAKLCDLGLW